MSILKDINKEIKGDYSKGEPPLPIPNREVKPLSADGTAKLGGRVGRCRFFYKPQLKLGFLFCRRSSVGQSS